MTSTTRKITHIPGDRIIATVVSKDKSFYKGNLDRAGLRSGSGVFCTSPSFYGEFDAVVDTEAYNSLIRWTEYEGNWLNDKPHGFGILRKVRGNGFVQELFVGHWRNGNQLRAI